MNLAEKKEGRKLSPEKVHKMVDDAGLHDLLRGMLHRVINSLSDIKDDSKRPIDEVKHEYKDDR